MKMPTESTALVAPSAASQPSEPAIAPDPLDPLDPVLAPGADHQPRSPHSVSIEAMVLLAGCFRNDLAEATGRPRLDLPLQVGQTVLNHWQTQVADWMSPPRQRQVPLRVLIQQSSPLPCSALETQGATPRLEHDPQDCRGTGGLLRDLAAAYEDDQWLLVATAAQVLLEPLGSLVSRLDEIAGDVRLLAHADGTPVGLMLIRCGALRGLERIGFVDLKEQGLPRIARSHRVGLQMHKQPTGLPITTHRDYLRALRWHHLRRGCAAMIHDPFAEDWQCAFATIEPGAQVDPSARLHDSVVLRGGRVERDATLVRSLVCPGAVVSRGQVVIDQLVRSRAR